MGEGFCSGRKILSQITNNLVTYEGFGHGSTLWSWMNGLVWSMVNKGSLLQYIIISELWPLVLASNY